MTDTNLTQEASAFAEAEWVTILGDLETLVAIESTEDRTRTSEGAPYGPGPRAALDAMGELLEGYSFQLVDCEGYCGYLEIPGESDRQLGMIGHLDVVPAGDGWTREPFALAREAGDDGTILFGRGVTDDKGPLLMGMHALRFWRNRYAREGRSFPVGIRMIFGCAEETGMEDAAYYLERHKAPDFLFTPDSDFPVCYGEKGHYQARITSKPLVGGLIASFTGGVALNGVPGLAEAVVRCPAANLTPRKGIQIDEDFDPAILSGDICGSYAGVCRIQATGVAGHAAHPEEAVSAIDLLASYLLDNALCDADERAWLEFVRSISSASDGSGLGIACSDKDFGALTCVGGMAYREGERQVQTIDVRFPTTIDLSRIEGALRDRAQNVSGAVEPVIGVEPWLVAPDSPEITALAAAYEEVSGQAATPYTSGGGTYARHFPQAVGFGAIDERCFPSIPGVGGMHAADEGVQEECLKQALVIYIVALGKLFELDWKGSRA